MTLTIKPSSHQTIIFADGLYAPDAGTIVPDGISGATPNTNFILETALENSQMDSLRVMLEINASFDWNSTYHENAYPNDPVYSGMGSVGQPALIYTTPYLDISKESILKMNLLGRAHHSGKNGLIYKDLKGITTAEQLIERILVFIEPSTPKKNVHSFNQKK